LTPEELKNYLSSLCEHQIYRSVMIWGAPGIGKSSVVAEVADKHELSVIDLRLSQLAPTDLRGLPVVGEGVAKWLPPEFLPNSGAGILFLDEINMAPPAVQGIAQQLILDRQIGTYQLPPDWFVWAAGNRKEDKAATFDMPSALANRFLHLDIEVSFSDFRRYGYQHQIDERILAFLAFRPNLLHHQTKSSHAWPSPRTWEMANELLRSGIEISPAIGHGTSVEFDAFCKIYEELPSIDGILSGEKGIKFPDEPSKKYAIVLGLVSQTKNANQAIEAILWLNHEASPEWLQLYFSDLLFRVRDKNWFPEMVKKLSSSSETKSLVAELRDMIMG
jgi:MoxR-like ATPase